MIAYSCGAFDILRARDLQDLEKKIQLSKQEGSKYFGVGIYDSNLCENLGFNTPLKSLEDRMNIMKYIIGIDFVFPVRSLQEDILKDSVRDAYQAYKREKESIIQMPTTKKKYELGYAPGTYDLFHAGHLENLLIASRECEKLIVGIKSDDLVKKHKNRSPIISENERMEIMRHFKFVYDAYIYYTRDIHIANDWVKAKYNDTFDAVYYGEDLKKDFADVSDFNIVFTPRSPEKMKKRSTTAYRKLHLDRMEGKFITGPHPETSPLKIVSKKAKELEK